FDGHVEGQSAAGEATVLRWEGQREQVLLAEELDDVPGELAAGVDVRGARRDLVAGEIAHRLADHRLLVVEADIHGRAMLPVAARATGRAVSWMKRAVVSSAG